MRVLFTTAARADLAEIEDYIRRESPRRAVTFTEELIGACEAIAELPFGFPVVPRYGQRGYRRKVHKEYLIFYRAEPDSIEIVRVVHGARDIAGLLSRVDK